MIVAVRPLRRTDVDAFATWTPHSDPLSRHYDLPVLTAADAEFLWGYLSGEPSVQRPYVGLLGDRVVAVMILRLRAAEPEAGELGIMLDPAYIGRGFGRRILGAFVTVLETEGFRRLHLEVSGYNGRAIAAYLANGFAVCEEYWAEPEPGVDVESLLDGPAAETVSPNVRLEPDGRYCVRVVRMERHLTPLMKDDLSP